MLAVGAVPDARRAADELQEIVTRYESTMLRAVADCVRGMVALAEGDADGALVLLRRGCRTWQELDAPYQAARTRVLIGSACHALGDEVTAELELEAARSAFAGLGAGPDLARVEMLLRPADAGDVHGLTRRELEVLRHLATGQTNRQIAATLVVSEHTVARHVQNILRKLRVPSRAAATAYAFEHDLV
jgi:DNA-binding CsgD family transcriptional regulator